MALARPPKAAGQDPRPAEPGDGLERPGLLGEVLPVLGRRAEVRADGAGPVAPGRPEAAAQCDENTIGVVAIMGSTMDGSYEPVAEINAALDGLAATPAASTCRSTWTPRQAGSSRRSSSRTSSGTSGCRGSRRSTRSGHKYGLVYPGVGWVVWRDADALPEDLIFKVNYLGGEMPTFALNFSRPGAQVAAQYYNFLRLGYSGYRQVQQTCQDIAMHLSAEIAKLGPFELLTDGSDLPVFAFKLRDDVDRYSVFDLSERLRMRGWQVPAYTFPENLTDMAVMRIVVRNGFSMDLANLLLDDMRLHLRVLEHTRRPSCRPSQKKRRSFAHSLARRAPNSLLSSDFARSGGQAGQYRRVVLPVCGTRRTRNGLGGTSPGRGGARGDARTPRRPSSPSGRAAGAA